MEDITKMLSTFEALIKKDGTNLEEIERKSNLNIDERRLLFELSYISHMKSHFEVQGKILSYCLEKNYLKRTIFDLGCGAACVDWTFLQRFCSDDSEGKFVGVDSSSVMLMNAAMLYLYNRRIWCKEPQKIRFRRQSPTKLYVYGLFKKPIINFRQEDITQLDKIVKEEGNPNTVLVSYCFHWLNKRKGVVERIVEDIHRHLENGGHFISIEEYPLRIGFEQDPVNNYIRENTEPINLEEKLYPLIQGKGFVNAEDTICYDIDTQQRLKLDFDTREHTHVMYGKVFQKKNI